LDNKSCCDECAFDTINNYQSGGLVDNAKASRAALFKKVSAPQAFGDGGIVTRIINEGAKRLGFDDERQIEITREAVDLTNQMVDAGLVDPKFRVKLRLPKSGEPSTRQNTGIEGDEEVFNAVNHALFSYHAGKNPLARAGSQAKEIYQGMRLGLAGKDPGSESLDYFNNLFGFDLARQGLSPEEAKSAIIDNIANIDNKGALSRLRAGEPLVAGKDLSRTAEDIRGSGPDVSAFDVLAGVQGFKDGGAPEKVPSSVLTGKGSFYGTPYREEPKVDTGETNLTLQQRLDQATPLEQYAYEVLGLEPGLDRGMMTPVAIRQSGDKEFALPALAYDSLKALLAPGAALSGRQVTPEETIELAMETMGSGLATPGVDIGTDVMAGMAMKPKGGVFVPGLEGDNPLNPNFMRDFNSGYAESIQENFPNFYAFNLITDNNVDEELAMGVAKRAENYFKKLYGTGEDPIRIKILEGDIEPAFAGGLTPDILKQARDDYATFKKGGPRVTPALERFERLYDINTGIRAETTLDYFEDKGGLLDSMIDAMVNEGVPLELISPATETNHFTAFKMAEKMLLEKSITPEEFGQTVTTLENRLAQEFPERESFLGTPRHSLDLEEYTEFLDNPSISTALEKGELIYDIDQYGPALGDGTGPRKGMLSFLRPENIVDGIADIPPDKLKNMSFPDIIENAQKNFNSAESQEIINLSDGFEEGTRGLKGTGENYYPETILERDLGDISPELLLKKGVVKVDDFGNEGWYRITKPVYTRLEGALMDHSVGGYFDQKGYNLGGPRAFKSGRAGIFSLRNNETGRPRLTVEIDFLDPDRPKPTANQIQGPSNSDIKAKDYDKLFSLYDEVGVLIEDVPRFLRDAYKRYKETGVSGMGDYFGPPDV